MLENWWTHYETENENKHLRTALIAIQNDQLRKTLCLTGNVEIDHKTATLNNAQLSALCFAIQEYEWFFPDQFTSQERNVGAVKMFHKKFQWTIGYYDHSAWQSGTKLKSLNPECAISTRRVLSIEELEPD